MSHHPSHIHPLQRFCGFLFGIALFLVFPVQADVGTEGASFLDIPVGGRAAALGGAYTALATDAYAPVWNPGGLGFLRSPQLAGMHVSYLETASYEFASVAVPVQGRHGLGLSVQFFNPGDIDGTDASGTSIGDFSGHFAAYTLAYGFRINDWASAGVAGKVIDAKIADATAHAYAGDGGVLLRPTNKLQLAAAVGNVGSKLEFLNQSDSLALVGRLGAAYQPTDLWTVSGEGQFRKNGLASGHVGVEVSPVKTVALRAGFRSDTLKELSALAGFSTGIGLTFWGQDFEYAWRPLGDLGSSQYFSILIRWGGATDAKTLQTPASAKLENSVDSVFGGAL